MEFTFFLKNKNISLGDIECTYYQIYILGKNNLKTICDSII